MPPKRRRNASSIPKGLQPGQTLRRDALPTVTLSPSTPWDWVGSEVHNVDQITQEHRLQACNLSKKNKTSVCSNKYSRIEVDACLGKSPTGKMALLSSSRELEEDIIVISDEDEEVTCSKKNCRSNPYCLNYLGQEIWEDEDCLSGNFAELAKLGRDPSKDLRQATLPVGLKNLGATCYANASLQVWYRDLAFRSGVFSCMPPEGISEDNYKSSPIFHLQVTFAALQEGKKYFHDPRPLIESLQLRASEQQDAQEFSKLFMSHLDAEFKKQRSPDVQSLVTKQFQGSLVYGMVCHACDNRSERISDFLEIEINFENDSTLEERLVASLLPETLSGDNKYFCPRCEALQDATRYTELRELPPVLHFSLLRFVYDVSSMKRKKLTHSISFPLTLDMRKFIGSKDVHERTVSMDSPNDLYELRGILLHKGASAYHGHYEAQVKDAQYDSWFQFNDETVTPIKSLGDTVPHKRAAKEKSNRQHTSDARKNRIEARKRKRIQDSDDEQSMSMPLKSRDTTSLVTSKDAYMLIYAKKHDVERLSSQCLANSQTNFSFGLPNLAMQVVKDQNADYVKECEDYRERENRTIARFRDLQGKVRDIYTSWTANDQNVTDLVVVSRQALETWLSRHCMEAIFRQDDNALSGSASATISYAKLHPMAISISGIVCEHGFLDPTKYREMKCINMRAFNLINETTNCTFEPFLKPTDVCIVCTTTIFKEKLYAVEHPKHTKLFEEISSVPDDDLGCWISKKWCKDWKLIKPKMHTFAENDPSPDSPEYHNDVYCEHGGLSLDVTSRRKISSEAMHFLQELFPSWQPLSGCTETCAICEAEVHIHKEDRQLARRRAEDEKARLKFIYQASLDSWADASERISCVVIPSLFVRDWKRWVNGPSDHARPDKLDNAQFFCEHGHLIFDPNHTNDLDSTLMIVESWQWDILQSIYPCGPMIALTRRPDENGGGYAHTIPVCKDCRLKRKSNWKSTEIIIRLSRPESSESSNSKTLLQPIKHYGRSNATRQSRRLRQVREHGQSRKITVSKSTTVKDIKFIASDEFAIPTICQRLYYQGRELEDSAETVASLQVLANDTLDLREVDEILEITSDSDERPPKKRREGPGFNGTLLGSADSPYPSSPKGALATDLPNSEKPCPTCTFSNQIDAVSCEICSTPFG